MSRARVALGTVVAMLVAATGASAAPTIKEYTGGVTPGFSANGTPGHIVAGYRRPPSVVAAHARAPIRSPLSGLDGSLWFTEVTNPGRVARLNPNGTVTELTGGVTPGFSANGFPNGIVARPGGDVWFTQVSGVGRVARIPARGGPLTELTGGVTSGFTSTAGPADITLGPDGLLWFTEQTNPGGVARVDRDGSVTQFTGGLTPGLSTNAAPQGITAGPDGNLWFAEQAGRIGRITPLGVVTEFTTGITPGSVPTGIATGPDGNLWFTQLGNPGSPQVPTAIGRITPAGEVTEFPGGVTPGLGRFDFVIDIAAGPDGNLWFTWGNGVGRITPAGAITEFPGGTTPGLSAGGRPQQITAGPDGAMWFTEAANPGRVGRITVGPGVTTGQATDPGPASVTLDGSVRPNGQTTTFSFEYGTTTAYGSQTPDAGAGAGSGARDVSADLSRLQPDTRYHYRLTATNDSATTTGADATFRTQPAPRNGGGQTGGGQTGPGGGPARPGSATAARLTRLRVRPRAFRTRATVRFRLDRRARVRFAVRHAGRKLRGFSRRAHAGRNRVHLRARRLAPGRYRLVARPRGGRPVRARFRIRP